MGGAPAGSAHPAGQGSQQGPLEFPRGQPGARCAPLHHLSAPATNSEEEVSITSKQISVEMLRLEIRKLQRPKVAPIAPHVGGGGRLRVGAVGTARQDKGHTIILVSSRIAFV